MALPGYLEDTAKDYAKQATGAYSVPIDTSKFTGRQFVAGEDPLQTSAINLAQQGVGSYAPYLSAAAANVGAAGTAAGGLGALTGAQAYQPFMSPYQTNVIDATLAEYDKSRLGGQQEIRDAAVGSGNFGGGREGAMMGQYNADSLVNRAALQNQMLQQGFGQAQNAAQQAFQNQQAIGAGQLGLGTAQMGLSNFQRAGLGADVGAYGQLGSLRQGQEQARLTADQQAAQTAAYEPYGRLSQYGTGITGLAGGVAGMQYNEPQQQSPMAQALGTAMGVGGLFGKIYG
tara:strand:- start:5736 stop:6596 length:861 start_codon:yes stop_codon:yes gene_type:complete